MEEKQWNNLVKALMAIDKKLGKIIEIIFLDLSPSKQTRWLAKIAREKEKLSVAAKE